MARGALAVTRGRRVAEPPDPASVKLRRVMLASEGRPIPPLALDFATRLAESTGAKVDVFSIARVWGTGLGFPNPGLLPSRREWDEQRRMVEQAVKKLKRRGVQAQGSVLATRKAAKRILSEAARLGCGAIVMAADPPRHPVIADFMWSQEPHRVCRRASVPVYLVQETETMSK